MPVDDGVREGDTIILDLALHHGQPTLSAMGRVVWLRSLNRFAPLKNEAGIEFNHIDSDAIEGLLNLSKPSSRRW